MLWPQKPSLNAPCFPQLPAGVDLYRLMMRHDFPEPAPLANERDMRGWWAGLPRSRTELRGRLMKRLFEKIMVGQPWRPKRHPKPAKRDTGSVPSMSTSGTAQTEGGRRSGSQLDVRSAPSLQGEDKEEIGLGESPEEEEARSAVKERLMLEGVQVGGRLCSEDRAMQTNLFECALG